MEIYEIHRASQTPKRPAGHEVMPKKLLKCQKFITRKQHGVKSSKDLSKEKYIGDTMTK